MSQNKKIVKNMFILFMITYPFFDITFFYNRITTLIRIIIIFSFYFVLLFINKETRKSLKFLIAYYFLVIIYAFCHHLNALNFKSVVPNNFNYSLTEELLQVFKLTIPFVFLIVTYYMDLKKKDYYNVIRSWILIICGSIVILNLLKLSYSSYNNEFIQGNILVWFFKHNYNYMTLSSKGFFMYANQISLIILIMLPIIYYLFITNQEKKDLFLIILLLLSALMLGTRVSSYGIIILLFILLCLYLFFSLIIKEYNLDYKIIIKTVILIVIYIFILPFSPSNNRLNVLNNINNTNNNDFSFFSRESGQFIEEDDIQKNNILKEFHQMRIYDVFILESYPYQYDFSFWANIFKLPLSKRMNYRFLEIAMVKRVVEINDNSYDVLWGITNTRIQNIFNIERDFVLQYYAFGIIGLFLFLGVYLYLFLSFFKNWVGQFNYLNSTSLIIVLLYLLTSYVSGNIINHLSTNLVFIFIITNFLKKDNELIAKI